MITFELFPGVCDAIKKQSFEVEFDGSTLGEAIQSLLKAYPHLGADVLLVDQTIRTTLATFVNDEKVSGEEREDFEIKDGDKITILTPLSGG